MLKKNLGKENSKRTKLLRQAVVSRNSSMLIFYRKTMAKYEGAAEAPVSRQTRRVIRKGPSE